MALLSRRRALWLTPLLAAACGGVEAGEERTPSVLVVALDGLRADRVGACTPVLDALLAKSRHWIDAVTPAPWSAPALAALLTGNYPSTVDLTGLGRPLDPRVWTLPEYLAHEGWFTGAAVSHPFAGSRHGLAQGFARFVELGYDPEQPEPAPPAGALAGAVTEAALELVDAAGERPFLVLAHYADPMPPWPPPRDAAFVDASYGGPVAGGLSFRDLLALAPRLDARDRAAVAALYDAEVAATDRAVGALLEGMMERGRLQQTHVLLLSLHGVELFDHGELGDAKTLYDELIHVPLALYGPGIVPGADATPASLIDVAPTLLDLCDVPVKGVEGVSLLSPAAAEPRALVAETDRARQLRAVMAGRWKLVRDLETGTQELFDLLEDPAEREDRAARGPTSDLSRALDAWGARHDD